MATPERPGAAALAVLLVGLTLTAVVWSYVRTTVGDEADLRFTEAADDIEAELVDRLEQAAAVTADMAAFLVDQPVPGTQDWDRRLAQVGVVERFPAIRAMNFARAVEPGQLAAWERDNGVEVFPARDGADLHAVIEAVHPLETNRGAIGLDLLGRPGAAVAVRGAVATGEVAASDVLMLVQDDDEAAGFVLYDAVRASEADGGAVRGWTGAAFRAQDLVDAMDLNTRLVAFELRDVETAEPATDLVLARGGAWPDEPPRSEVRTLDLLGQQWEVELRQADPLVGTIDGRAPALTLLLGALVTAAAASYVRSLRARQLRAAAGEADAMARLEATNRRLEERNDALMAANEVKDDFLAVVSHEFRTPLTVIRGFATTVLANDDGLDERVVDALGRIDRNASRLNTLVDDLLVAARIERGVVQPSPTPVDLVHLCVEVVEELRWSDDELTLDTEPATAWADAAHVRRVVENLLGNAAKYGAPPVRVSVRQVDGAALVEVRDHGTGIPDHLRGSLFTAFTQGESGPTRRGKGVGLGLAISLELAELNGGSLALADSDSGARFVLTLPRAQASPS